jgi:hypothetical protein
VIYSTSPNIILETNLFFYYLNSFIIQIIFSIEHRHLLEMYAGVNSHMENGIAVLHQTFHSRYQKTVFFTNLVFKFK